MGLIFDTNISSQQSNQSFNNTIINVGELFLHHGSAERSLLCLFISTFEMGICLSASSKYEEQHSDSRIFGKLQSRPEAVIGKQYMNGCTIFHVVASGASEPSNYRAMNLLLDKIEHCWESLSADPGVQRCFQMTESSSGLHPGVRITRSAFLKLLLGKTDDKGRTALSISAQLRHSNMCSLLLQKGSSIWQVHGKKGLTVLHVACMPSTPIPKPVNHHNHQMSTVAGTIQSGPPAGVSHIPTSSLSAPVPKAAAGHYNGPKTLRVLLGSIGNETERVRYMSTCSKTGMTALHYAAAVGDTQCVSELLDNGADMYCSTTELDMCSKENTLPRQMLLFQPGSTPLHVAAIAGYKDVAMLLLMHHVVGASSTAQVTSRHTPGHLPTGPSLRILPGPDPRLIFDKHGNLPLHYGTYRRDLATILHPSFSLTTFAFIAHPGTSLEEGPGGSVGAQKAHSLAVAAAAQKVAAANAARHAPDKTVASGAGAPLADALDFMESLDPAPDTMPCTADQPEAAGTPPLSVDVFSVTAPPSADTSQQGSLRGAHMYIEATRSRSNTQRLLDGGEQRPLPTLAELAGSALKLHLALALKECIYTLRQSCTHHSGSHHSGPVNTARAVFDMAAGLFTRRSVSDMGVPSQHGTPPMTSILQVKHLSSHPAPCQTLPPSVPISRKQAAFQHTAGHAGRSASSVQHDTNPPPVLQGYNSYSPPTGSPGFSFLHNLYQHHHNIPYSEGAQGEAGRSRLAARLAKLSPNRSASSRLHHPHHHHDWNNPSLGMPMGGGSSSGAYYLQQEPMMTGRGGAGAAGKTTLAMPNSSNGRIQIAMSGLRGEAHACHVSLLPCRHGVCAGCFRQLIECQLLTQLFSCPLCSGLVSGFCSIAEA
ncbi:hypothetical protein CEUSTIGMA_g922.t1 [Chlamydomonas eustigma]|uniref:Uncharacterized protein n=1 Tax=Chlamydomonas eustigma TaxID=1157962 RepID=A0A250WSG1_9CHLO|nr:hypothetical protein CEUSTIGMA_g922.t1 [Chlamydomonas eustigma]|eukprot:GAX73470.1 hypothetical protein CEUSTIGMA_g922.t1 [Chlamydomonas eustigma]